MALPAGWFHTWEVGVNLGVRGGYRQYLPGGASERVTEIEIIGADPDGIVDCTAEAQTAFDAAILANNGSVVTFPVAGTYLITGIGTANLYPRNFTFRPKDGTIIKYNGATSGRLFAFGNGSNFNYPIADNVILSGNTQDSETIEIADAVTPGFAVNQTMRLEWENQQDNAKIIAGAVPVLHTYGFEYVRNQMVIITAISVGTGPNGGDEISFTPGIYHDPDPDLNARVRYSGFYASGIGFENFLVDGNENDPYSLIELTGAYDCWVHNVDTRRALNYNISFAGCVYVTAGTSVIRNRTGVGTNGAGILANNTSSILIENCVIFDLFPCIEWNFCTTGYVSCSFWNGTMNFNHGPHNTKCGMENSIGSNIQLDGYFGGVSEFTLVGCWVTGNNIDPSSPAYGLTIPSALNRLARDIGYQGNIFGHSSYPLSVCYSDGNPYLGNSTFYGEADPVAGDFWGDWKGRAILTTRATDRTGTITLQGGATNTFNRFRSYIKWSDFLCELSDIVTGGGEEDFLGVFTFTSDADLPAEGTEMDYFPGPIGFQEKDNGVARATHRENNRLINFESNAIISGESSADPIPDSMIYPSAPPFMAGYTWPPAIRSSNSAPSYTGVLPAADLYFSVYASLSDPEITSPPTISGTGVALSTLTAVAGGVTGGPPPVRDWQWQIKVGEDGVDVDGETAITFIPPIDEVGSFYRVRQHEENDSGEDEAFSEWIEILPFMGDVFVPEKTANILAVVDVWRLRDDVTGTISYFLNPHSGPWPADPPNVDDKSYERNWGNASKDCYTYIDNGEDDSVFIASCL